MGAGGAQEGLRSLGMYLQQQDTAMRMPCRLRWHTLAANSNAISWDAARIRSCRCIVLEMQFASQPVGNGYTLLLKSTLCGAKSPHWQCMLVQYEFDTQQRHCQLSMLCHLECNSPAEYSGQ
jgi:hypothetical protein